ncbi:retrovirus-related Pol polyprotein from transposon 17.6 [Trichonephila clavipes]|nr:retrovirus-related Pol polyprotein from transposon 17.6 [Trichonephila clavipes]
MEQQIADLLRQNQDLIRALQIRDDSHSHKVTVQFDKFDEENENFDSFIERFETYLDVQNVPIATRAKVFVSSLSAKLYQLLKNLLAPDIPSTKPSDASPVGIGCVLSHVYPDGSNVRLRSHQELYLGPRKNTPQIDKEALSIVWASFEFDIIFRKTIDHGNADFLSRLPKTSEELEVKDDITISSDVTD